MPNKSKLLGTLFCLALSACASSGKLKVNADSQNPNNIPEDTLENFLVRYDHFILNDERKAIKKIDKRLKELTKKNGSPEEREALLKEREQLIVQFWTKRDLDPTTPENEFKQIIDERINDIAEERFFASSETPGLLFRSNGGFPGDMAHVYLLHGEPDARSRLENFSQFHDMMLWLYADPGGEGIRFAFLFYQRGAGEFRLFPQDSYQMDVCAAISEAMTFRSYAYHGGGNQPCPDDVVNAYMMLRMASASDGTPGYLFAWALTNFSSDSGLMQGHALEPPLPAAMIARQTPSRVVGESPQRKLTAGVDYFPASCNCKTFIPAQPIMETFTIFVRRKDLDLILTKDGSLGTILALKVVMESVDDLKKPPVFLDLYAKILTTKELLTDEPEGPITIRFLKSEDAAKIPAGRYRVNIYLRNVLTNKYSAWETIFTKQ